MEAENRDSSLTATVKTPVSLDGRLEIALARPSDVPLREGNQLKLLKNGPDTYHDWLAEIERAAHWVHLENYIFQADEVGERFADALWRRRRKVCGQGALRLVRLPGHAVSFLAPATAGVEVQSANPPTLGTPLGVVRRDHHKLLAVDDTYASTGGVCISEGWLVRSPDTGLAYRYTAVSVRGPAVGDLERAFAGAWDEAGQPLPEEERPEAENISLAGDDSVHVVI
jgi:cardiolipin synthase A/B